MSCMLHYLGGVVVPPTSRPVAPSSDIIPLVSAIVAVIFIIALFGVGIVVMAVVLIRRKAHIQGETYVHREMRVFIN